MGLGVQMSYVRISGENYQPATLIQSPVDLMVAVDLTAYSPDIQDHHDVHHLLVTRNSILLNLEMVYMMVLENCWVD